MTAEGIQLSTGLSDRFQRFIADRSGLYFKGHDVKVLEDAVRERAASWGLESGDAYLLYLMSRPGGEDELKELLNLITVGHTYFFRNESHFQVLREEVLPEIIDRKSRQSGVESGVPAIKIWSAGCSTGEEAYSIAISVMDVMRDTREWDIRIYATDISAGALDAARRGSYSRNAVRRVSAGHLEEYFVEESRDGGRYRIKDKIKGMVQFDFLNIWEPPYPSGVDIIFCRNVLIYFKLDSILGVINRLYESLIDGGYLFMGGSESPQFFTDQFEMKTWGDAVYYRKGGEDSSEHGRERLIHHRKVVPGRDVIKAPSGNSLDVADESRSRSRKEDKGDVDDVMEGIRVCIQREDYASAHLLVKEALALKPDSAEAHCLAAEVDTRQGRLKEAKERLEHILQVDPLFAPAHCLFGLISFEEGDYKGAKVRLRKALYLDGKFPMARFLLGVIHEGEGQWEEALREYKNTVEILADESPRGIISFSGGFNAKALSDISRANIERLQSRR